MKPVKQLFDITNQVAIITGGLGLLGAKHAEAIAEISGIPILLDVNKNTGSEIANRIANDYKVTCEYIQCDITDETKLIEARDEVINKFGHIDILINNAAIDTKVKAKNDKNFSRLENFPIEQWDLELSVGLKGPMLCSKVFGVTMANAGKGIILNISSDLGIIAPDQRIYKKDHLSEDMQPVKPVTYSVIKHGVIGLTKYMATYWPGKVRCNALCPGGVYIDQPIEFVKKITNLIPLGRMATENEYMGAIQFLCSNASTYLNGSVITMDGGRSCW